VVRRRVGSGRGALSGAKRRRTAPRRANSRRCLTGNASGMRTGRAAARFRSKAIAPRPQDRRIGPLRFPPALVRWN
jgi:hypothetical protein